MRVGRKKKLIKYYYFISFFFSIPLFFLIDFELLCLDNLLIAEESSRMKQFSLRTKSLWSWIKQSKFWYNSAFNSFAWISINLVLILLITCWKHFANNYLHIGALITWIIYTIEGIVWNKWNLVEREREEIR